MKNTVPEATRYRRRAFTLVELLVVIAIIGILIALLLPAVQAAREAARRSQNANNLKQIGLALAMYEDTWKRYPAVRFGDPRGDQYMVSWAFRLLPYLEQEAMFDPYDYSKETYHVDNAPSMRTALSVFANPSRRAPCADCRFEDYGAADPGDARGTCGDYAANRGWHDPTVALLPDNTCCEPFRGEYSGPMGHHFGVTIAQVRDGLSNTIAVGDRWVGPTDPDFVILTGDNPWSVQRGAERGFPTGPDDPSQEKFGHPNGGSAAFAFLDGHVSWISYTVALDVLKALCAVADGTPISGSDY
jgi:prepilin-type N-terminal cleavage/methylation domain-containing protein/prepilin-type processing-associated H-X9-DG protein